MKIGKLFKSSSTKNIYKLNNLILLEYDLKMKNKKFFKSQDKFINKKKNFDINIKNKNINLKNDEINQFEIVNKKSEKHSETIAKSKININKEPTPVNTISFCKNVNKKIISKQKQSSKVSSNKNKNELYSQKIEVSCMREKPPKLPELFSHNYNFKENELILDKSNETFGKLNKETIPITFYNHLMINNTSKKFVNNRNKYFKTSITQRNKKKLLTIIYYSP